MGVGCMRMVGGALLVWLACAGAHAAATSRLDACFERHAARFGLDPDLLRSIALVESGMRPQVDNDRHLARTGSRDIGLMQINTTWLPVLERFGIGLAELRDPCTNIEVGAWILADLLNRHGNHWEALGAYNAACTQLRGAACRQARTTYAWHVWRARQRQGRQDMPEREPDTPLPPASPQAPLRATGLLAASAIHAAAAMEPSP